MRKIALTILAVGFTAAMLGAPAMAAGKKKDAPGKGGVMKYYDKKAKACKSKG